jgi:hypothetical protein
MKEKQSKKWSVQISTEVAQKLKTYCDERGYTMAHVVERGVIFAMHNDDIVIPNFFKSTNRFICKFLTNKSAPPSFVIKQMERPKCEINRNTESNENLSKIKWHPIKLTLYDTVDPNISEIVTQTIENNIIFDLEIRMLNEKGDILEKWLIKNGRISMVDFGSVSWEIHKAAEIFLTIEYEYAKLILE